MVKKILIVDDEPHILELIKAVLEVEKFEIITATNGVEALKKLEAVTPDLVILDMMMPGMSGREVCESIRKNPKTKNQKVIFLTVARFSETGKKVLDDMKVSDYITKPFETKDLVTRINSVLKSK
ncbi:MAG: response regulator [Candidatus Woesearchaeota archaeon]|nr:response regulator [Candidatus Woesearchaeota archaeon]